MKSLKKDINTEAFEVGRNTSRVAEAVLTDIDLKFAEILTANKKTNVGSVDEAFDVMEKRTLDLLNTALGSFKDIASDITPITEKIFEKNKKQAKRIIKLDSNDEIKDYLKKITGRQILDNKQVVYKNGRRIGYKEYVEMATRTRMQHQLLEQQFELGLATAQLVYVCDTYSDCANDHLDYQGKFYYDEQVMSVIPKELKDALRKSRNKFTSSIQKITTSKPWLGTRPNCRHRFIPIAIDDFLGMPLDKVLRKHEAIKGNYSNSEIRKNYKDTQSQRRHEHAIRQLKVKHEINRMAYEKTNDKEFLNKMNSNAFHIRKNQKRLRELIAQNPSLKRDYRKENPYHLQKDLGVAYNYGKVQARIYAPQDFDIGKDIKFLDQSKKALLEIKKNRENGFESLERYVGSGHEAMNMAMYDRERLVKEYPKAVVDKAIKDVNELHKLFASVREKDIKTDKAFVVYRGGSDLVEENDTTTIIFNGFTSTSLEKEVAMNFLNDNTIYKIIIPPESQNQALYIEELGEKEILIDTNAVFDIIGVEDMRNHKQYTLLLRPKHKGVKR